MTTAPRTVDRLIGVYHSDAGWYGEAAQATRRFLGTASCSLADLTHHKRHPGGWNEIVESLAVDFDLVYLNQRTPEVAAITQGRTPCVLAVVGDELVVLLRNQDLDRIDGNHAWFVRELHERAEEQNLLIPTNEPKEPDGPDGDAPDGPDRPGQPDAPPG